MKLLFLSSPSRKKWILAVKSPSIIHPLVQHWILVKSSVQGFYPVQVYQAQTLMVPCWLGEQLKKFLPIAVSFRQLEFVPSLLSTLLLHQARLIKKCSLISCTTLAASAQGCQYEIGSSALGYPALVTSVTGLSTWDSQEVTANTVLPTGFILSEQELWPQCEAALVWAEFSAGGTWSWGLFQQRPLVLHQVPFFISEIRVAEVGLGRDCGVVSQPPHRTEIS